MSPRAMFYLMGGFLFSVNVGCGDSTDPSGGTGAGGQGQGASSNGGDDASGGSGGAPATFPPLCMGTPPVAGLECTTQDEVCDGPSTMSSCGLERFRCCDGRWRGKEACDGEDVAPNQPSCFAL